MRSRLDTARATDSAMNVLVPSGRCGPCCWTDGLALVVLLGATIVGFGAQQRIDGLMRDFPRYWSGREAEVGSALEKDLDNLIQAGESAARELARAPSVVDPDARYRWV